MSSFSRERANTLVNLAHISRINNNYFYTNGVEISGCYDIPDTSGIKFRNLIPELLVHSVRGISKEKRHCVVIIG